MPVKDLPGIAPRGNRSPAKDPGARSPADPGQAKAPGCGERLGPAGRRPRPRVPGAGSWGAVGAGRRPWGAGVPGGRGPGRPGRVFVMHRPRGKWCISPEDAPARAPVLSPPGAPPRRNSAPPRPDVVQQIAVVLRFGYLFILLGRGTFPLEKGARILREIRLNAICGVFEIGGQGGGESAMRGREMPERGLNWKGNRIFRWK